VKPFQWLPNVAESVLVAKLHVADLRLVSGYERRLFRFGRAANQGDPRRRDPSGQFQFVLSNMTPENIHPASPTNMSVDLGRPRLCRTDQWNTPTLRPGRIMHQSLATATADFLQSPTDLVFIPADREERLRQCAGRHALLAQLKDYMHYESLNRLPEVRLRAALSPKSTVAGKIGEGNDLYVITLSNNSSAPARANPHPYHQQRDARRHSARVL